MSDRRPTPASQSTPLPSITERPAQGALPHAPVVPNAPPRMPPSGAIAPVRYDVPPANPRDATQRQGGGAHYRDTGPGARDRRDGVLRAWLSRTSVWQRMMLAVVLASSAVLVAILVWALLARRA